MEIEYHTNALTNGQSIIIDAFELKQTPGATCNGSAPPCIQLYPTPIELPDIVTDLQRNARFAQLIGSGYQVGINSGNRGFVETTSALAYSTTLFLSSWALPVAPRCNTWVPGPVGGDANCPTPLVYIANLADYTFNTPDAQFVPTALSARLLGQQSIQLVGTTSGMTKGTAGWIEWGNGTTNPNMILLYSAVHGD